MQTFPNILKIAKVIPLHKGGSSLELNNYRHISLLSVFDKIMEKIIHKQLYNFLESHNILFKNQYGFRKNNSTIYAIIEIVEKIRESIDQGKLGCGIYVVFRWPPGENNFSYIFIIWFCFPSGCIYWWIITFNCCKFIFMKERFLCLKGPTQGQFHCSPHLAMAQTRLTRECSNNQKKCEENNLHVYSIFFL